MGWIRAEDQTILTLDTKVVTHNGRVSVTHDGAQTWNLHIRHIRETDRGFVNLLEFIYMLQYSLTIFLDNLYNLLV